jgi:hypothetical protein
VAYPASRFSQSCNRRRSASPSTRSARRHPDWFTQNPFGQPASATYNTAYFPLAKWNNIQANPGGLGQWFYLYPRLTSLESLDWGIDQLILSSQEYGWEGVRFDGDFSWNSGNDEGRPLHQIGSGRHLSEIG